MMKKQQIFWLIGMTPTSSSPRQSKWTEQTRLEDGYEAFYIFLLILTPFPLCLPGIKASSFCSLSVKSCLPQIFCSCGCSYREQVGQGGVLPSCSPGRQRRGPFLYQRAYSLPAASDLQWGRGAETNPAGFNQRQKQNLTSQTQTEAVPCTVRLYDGGCSPEGMSCSVALQSKLLP